MGLLQDFLICYLDSNEFALQIQETVHRVQIPNETMYHSEVIEEDNLRDLLHTFIESLPIKKKKGIVFLSPALVFSFTIPRTHQEQEVVLDQFLDMVPLNKKDVVYTIQTGKDTFVLEVANRTLYSIVVDVLTKTGIEIQGVFPGHIFGIVYNKSHNIFELTSNPTNIRKYDLYNFLNKEKVLLQKTVLPLFPSNNNKKHFTLLLVSLFLFSCAVFYLLLWSESIKNPWFNNNKVISHEIKDLPLPVDSVSPTEKIYDKTSVSISILNGSGSSGEAAKLSNLLQGAGYKNIHTGNAEEREIVTTVRYTPAVPLDVATNILDIVQKEFTHAVLQEASISAVNDIVITTGN